VRCNGKTISKGPPFTGSGGSERADDDTQALYVHLWGKANQTICPVIPPRGATALADFNDSKVLTLPDMRGRAAFGIDIMNNASSGRIAAAYMDTGGVNELGASGGDDAIGLVADNIAAHSHDATGVPAVVGPPAVAEKPPLRMPAHSHLMVDKNASPSSSTAAPLTAALPIAERSFTPGDDTQNVILAAGTTADAGKTGTSAADATANITGNTGLNVTTGAAHENMPPFMLFTYYIKL
jgi:microcystin-dependent protein